MAKRTILTLALLAALTGDALAAEAPASPKVNINKASTVQLQLLPRVGPALAQRIVEFRTANGAFKAPEEIVRVKGIGEKTFALLKPYVAIDGDTTLTEKVKASRKPKPEQKPEKKPAPKPKGQDG